MSRFADPNEAPLSAGALLRYRSRELRSLGFRYGAPIYRATATFTLNDLTGALFGRSGEDDNLVFTTVIERLKIEMSAGGVQRFISCCPDADFCYTELFPGTHERNVWVVSGDLQTEPNAVGVKDIATAEVYMPPSGREEPVDREEEAEMLLTVLAVVAFDHDGQFVSAMVQRVPSPADQLLYLPPL